MTQRLTFTRGGTYYRVVDPGYADPLDTSYAKIAGGRWNAAGQFGALYLCASTAVAAANARFQFTGRAIKLFDLLASARPELVTVDVPRVDVVDVVTVDGIQTLNLPPNYPYGIPWAACQSIAREAYAAGVDGVAARSNAEATATWWVGEELAVFDRFSGVTQLSRRPFAQWYSDPIPESTTS